MISGEVRHAGGSVEVIAVGDVDLEWSAPQGVGGGFVVGE